MTSKATKPPAKTAAKAKAPTKAALAKQAKLDAANAKPVRNPNNYTTAAVGVEGLRKAIAAAQADGVANRYMTLHLSRRDLAILKRSSDVAVHEIRFSDGEMKFLDIKVAAEPAEFSHLERPKAKAAAPEAPAQAADEEPEVVQESAAAG